jgi:hypothetical protein
MHCKIIDSFVLQQPSHQLSVRIHRNADLIGGLRLPIRARFGIRVFDPARVQGGCHQPARPALACRWRAAPLLHVPRRPALLPAPRRQWRRPVAPWCASPISTAPWSTTLIQRTSPRCAAAAPRRAAGTVKRPAGPALPGACMPARRSLLRPRRARPTASRRAGLSALL